MNLRKDQSPDPTRSRSLISDARQRKLGKKQTSKVEMTSSVDNNLKDYESRQRSSDVRIRNLNSRPSVSPRPAPAPHVVEDDTIISQGISDKVRV